MQISSPSKYWGTSIDLSAFREGMDARQANDLFSGLGRRIFGDCFDYSKSVFRALFISITIGCPVHGEVECTPAEHLIGLRTGCPKCELER